MLLFSIQCDRSIINLCPALLSRRFSSVIPVTGVVDVNENLESRLNALDQHHEQLKHASEIQSTQATRSSNTPLGNDPPVSEYSSEDITVTGRDAPKPFLHFSDFKWPKEILDVMERNKYSNPTPIQCQALPVALERRDLIGIAQTGSGKTLGFILPMIVNLDTPSLKHVESPRAVVLAPTRELAQQIQTVARQFRSLRSVCVYGGAYKGEQLRAISDQNPVLIVATPGRLNDLIDSGYLSMNDVRYLVLDEADRMLDMGFEPQIRSVIDNVPKDHQTLMWSATWPEEVRDLANDFLNDPIHVSVGGTELRANPNIKQVVQVVDQREKMNKLMDVIESLGTERGVKKTLIFAQTKACVDFITKALSRKGVYAAGIHSGRSQSQRDTILNNFRRGRCDVLVATDVAARGLDVDDIETVINYDFPNGTEDYIHRIGRTARAGKDGQSITFFTEENAAYANELVKVLGVANQQINPDLHRMVKFSRMNRTVKKSFRGQPPMQRMVNKYDSFNASRPNPRERIFTREDYFGTRTNSSRYEVGGRPVNYEDDRVSGGRNHGGRRQHRLDEDDY